MNTIYVNRILYKDVPVFMTKNNNLILNTIWNFVKKPPVKGKEYVFCYIQNTTYNYVMRTTEGFYYLMSILAFHPFTKYKTKLYPTLDFLNADFPILPTGGNNSSAMLDIYNMDKYNDEDIVTDIHKNPVYVVYRTKEGFCYAGINSDTKTPLFPTLQFMNKYIEETILI